MSNLSDNLPVMLMGSWDTTATLFDGDVMAGPVPTLFSEDIEGSLAGLKNDPFKGHWDLMRMARLMFMPEVVNYTEAKGVVKKPR